MPFQWLAVTKVYFLLILFVGCTLAMALFQAVAWLYVLIWGTQAAETVSVYVIYSWDRREEQQSRRKLMMRRKLKT